MRYVTMLQVLTLMTLLLQLQQFTTLHQDYLRLHYGALSTIYYKIHINFYMFITSVLYNK